MKRHLCRPSLAQRPDSRTLRSDDGLVAFTLARTARGVFVERFLLRHDQACVMQSALFTDGQSFERWCDADVVRFHYPLVHLDLKRNGHALFGQPA